MLAISLGVPIVVMAIVILVAISLFMYTVPDYLKVAYPEYAALFFALMFVVVLVWLPIIVAVLVSPWITDRVEEYAVERFRRSRT